MEKSFPTVASGGPALPLLCPISPQMVLPWVESESEAQVEGWSEGCSQDGEHRSALELRRLSVVAAISAAEVRCQTLLPLPQLQHLASDRVAKDRDRVASLELSAASWGRQIRAILQQQPEAILEQRPLAGPRGEVEFWRRKAAHLASLRTQLRGDPMRRVLRVLEVLELTPPAPSASEAAAFLTSPHASMSPQVTKSSQHPPLLRLAREVEAAYSEAEESARYLGALQPPIVALDASEGLDDLVAAFRPLLHSLLLVWRHSRAYHSSTRLSNLLCLVSNAVAAKGRAYLNSTLHATTPPTEAAAALGSTLRACGTLKALYFEYRSAAFEERPDRPWPTPQVFRPLDMFLERCHDQLHVSRTAAQYETLHGVELGGQSGRALSARLVQLSAAFASARSALSSSSPDPLAAPAETFDPAFCAFRAAVKSLDRQRVSRD